MILALSEGGCAVLRLILSPSLGLNVQSVLKGDRRRIIATRDIGLVQALKGLEAKADPVYMHGGIIQGRSVFYCILPILTRMRRRILLPFTIMCILMVLFNFVGLTT